MLAPFHILIAVQQTIPHASAMAPIARNARRRSGSISMSPISRRLVNASARGTRKVELKLTSGGPCQTSAVRTLSQKVKNTADRKEPDGPPPGQFGWHGGTSLPDARPSNHRSRLRVPTSALSFAELLLWNVWAKAPFQRLVASTSCRRAPWSAHRGGTSTRTCGPDRSGSSSAPCLPLRFP